MEEEEIDTLYLIDDDEVFLFLTEKIVAYSNKVKNIQTFKNGYEAIEHLKSVKDQPENLPDVIFLDISMPVMDGWNFLEEYKNFNDSFGKKIYVYIITSSIDPKDYEKARSVNEVTDFIIKPVTKEKFQELVKQL